MIVEDHPVFREVLVQFVARLCGVRLVAEASDGHAAVAMASTLALDAVLMDVDMPGIDGVEATRAIVKHQPDVDVIAFSFCDEDAVMPAMCAAGAVGYIAKGQSARCTDAALRRVFGCSERDDPQHPS